MILLISSYLKQSIIDSAYSISPQVIIPYPSNSTDRQERLFNRDHSSTRIIIENSFSLLVNRWRFLFKHLYLLNIERIAKTILTSCLLHNLCISMNDDDETFVTSEQLAEQMGRVDEEPPVQLEPAMPPPTEENMRSQPGNTSANRRRSEGIARRDSIKRQLTESRGGRRTRRTRRNRRNRQ